MPPSLSYVPGFEPPLWSLEGLLNRGWLPPEDLKNAVLKGYQGWGAAFTLHGTIGV